MANTKIVFDVEANISQIKEAATQISNTFNKLSLPQKLKNDFTGTFNKLTNEIRDFEVRANKGFNSLKDAQGAEKSIDKIVGLFENLKVQAKDMSGMDLSKFIPDSIVNKLKQYKNLLGEINKLQSRNNSKEISDQTKAIEQQKNKVQGLENELKGLNTTLNEQKESLKKAEKEYKEYIKIVEDAKKTLAEMEATAPDGQKTKVKNSKEYIEAQSYLKEAKLNEQSAKSGVTRKSNAVGSTEVAITKKAGDLSTETAALERQKDLLEELKNKSLVTEEEIKKVVIEFSKLSGIEVNKLPEDLTEIATKIQQLVAEGADTTQIEKTIGELAVNCEKAGAAAGTTQKGVEGIVEEKAGLQSLNSEVDMLKSRLGYFFSIANGIQLFKRAVRDAYESVKELDAAMTEMAVVTKYNVAELWSQMPEYAKNANELGTTTLDVYKSMVLYTQQGLEAAQAQELSNQTLRMARIAGMEASEATDAMTSALRGFNMELTEASGQRINDVYSNLAAHAAANTEEISGAMMRTASIAHSAGMEFETTAAFLTQMINHATLARVA